MKRLWPVAAYFLVAFALDMATGQRHSAIWGSAAIIASLVTLFPALGGLVALASYATLWIVFNAIRAFADNTGLALAEPTTIAGMESRLFGGSMPSAFLQARFFDSAHVDGFDAGMSLIYGSYFVAPFLVAGVAWWKRRGLFRVYTIATAICFALGLAGFVLFPTVPPWLSEPGKVTRVVRRVLAEGSGTPYGGDGRFWFEPNHIAAFPSIHVAMIVLVFLVLRTFGWFTAIGGAIYALLMTVSVVYLGEHFAIDAVFGWVVALCAWRFAMHWGFDTNENGLHAARSSTTISGGINR